MTSSITKPLRGEKGEPSPGGGGRGTTASIWEKWQSILRKIKKAITPKGIQTKKKGGGGKTGGSPPKKRQRPEGLYTTTKKKKKKKKKSEKGRKGERGGVRGEILEKKCIRGEEKKNRGGRAELSLPSGRPSPRIGQRGSWQEKECCDSRAWKEPATL